MTDQPKRPTPSRSCPACHGLIEGEGVVYEHREYCSSDCAIDAYEEHESKRKEHE